MMEQLPKTAIALLAGLAIGAGVMYGLITGHQAKQENIILKEQAHDRNRRQAITADIASSSEKNRRSIHQTMKALHDQTETRIADNDNVHFACQCCPPARRRRITAPSRRHPLP